jgi:hypothetical protein
VIVVKIYVWYEHQEHFIYTAKDWERVGLNCSQEKRGMPNEGDGLLHKNGFSSEAFFI